jgi:protein-S-isoprenylcysteine O-methyltransferase Ste14
MWSPSSNGRVSTTAGALASGWLLVLAVGVLLGTHLVVRREERRLLARFGSTYAAYAATVRRYV